MITTPTTSDINGEPPVVQAPPPCLITPRLNPPPHPLRPPLPSQGPDPGPVSPTLCTTATGVRGRGRELGAPTPTLVPTRHVLPVVIFMVIHTLTIMKMRVPVALDNLVRQNIPLLEVKLQQGLEGISLTSSQ